jgi:hypothetical protein
MKYDYERHRDSSKLRADFLEWLKQAYRSLGADKGGGKVKKAMADTKARRDRPDRGGSPASASEKYQEGLEDIFQQCFDQYWLVATSYRETILKTSSLGLAPDPQGRMPWREDAELWRKIEAWGEYRVETLIYAVAAYPWKLKGWNDGFRSRFRSYATETEDSAFGKLLSGRPPNRFVDQMVQGAKGGSPEELPQKPSDGAEAAKSPSVPPPDARANILEGLLKRRRASPRTESSGTEFIEGLMQSPIISEPQTKPWVRNWCLHDSVEQRLRAFAYLCAGSGIGLRTEKSKPKVTRVDIDNIGEGDDLYLSPEGRGRSSGAYVQSRMATDGAKQDFVAEFGITCARAILKDHFRGRDRRNLMALWNGLRPFCPDGYVPEADTFRQALATIRNELTLKLYEALGKTPPAGVYGCSDEEFRRAITALNFDDLDIAAMRLTIFALEASDLLDEDTELWLIPRAILPGAPYGCETSTLTEFIRDRWPKRVSRRTPNQLKRANHVHMWIVAVVFYWTWDRSGLEKKDFHGALGFKQQEKLHQEAMARRRVKDLKRQIKKGGTV